MNFRKNLRHPIAPLVLLGLAAACATESGEGLQQSDPVEDPTVSEPEIGKTRVPLDFELDGQTITELSITEIRGSTVQFRVRSTSPFLAGSLDPLVRIGETILSDYTYEELNTVLVYTTDLSTLPDRGRVLFGWGGGGEISEGVTTDCVFLKETRSFGAVDR